MSEMEFKTVTSDEGATFTPWTDGWAVGFRIKHPNRPTRYIYLNPSGGNDDSDVDSTNVFVYQGAAGDPVDDAPVCYVHAWDDAGATFDTCTRCGGATVYGDGSTLCSECTDLPETTVG